MSESSRRLIDFVREKVPGDELVPLHEPEFGPRDFELVNETLKSTFVSSVGEFVGRFEQEICRLTSSDYAIAVVNGTAGLHTVLYALGIGPGDLVITQSLTFIATCNSILQTGAAPVLLDVDRHSLSLDPVAVRQWLSSHCKVDDQGHVYSIESGGRVKAIMPMHTFGFPADLPSLSSIAEEWGLELIADAAEALGSTLDATPVGKECSASVYSFNGNKIITTGGGGVITTSNENLARRLKFLTTTAKINHPWEFEHEEMAFNYRLPNLNAALGVAQLEAFPDRLILKHALADQYKELWQDSECLFLQPGPGARSNDWLNNILCKDRQQRDEVLAETNAANIATRPVWNPMHKQRFLSSCERDENQVTEWLADRIVSLPSSAYLGGR